ncbi:putative small lipoprotein YifL [Chryseobacterium sp. W4I1]|nr:putative small lipoprotein YifL [Chryseobacterium sp. W4I1]
MKNSLKVLFLAMLLILLNSCGAIATYDAPLEPGQIVF